MKNRRFAILFGLVLMLCCFSCKKVEETIVSVDLGEGKYKEPFRGLLSSHPQWLVSTLDWPVLRSLRPDTLVLTKTIEIGFNEDAVRSHSTATIQFVDDSCNRLEGVKVYCNGKFVDSDGYVVEASSEPQLINIAYKIDPLKKECTETGHFIISGVELDEVNALKLSSDIPQNVADWTFTQKIGWPLLLWLVWLIMALVIIAVVFGVLILIFKVLGITNPSFNFFGVNMEKPRLPKNGERGNWSGEKGNSEFVFNKKFRPKNKHYNNPYNKTVKQLGKELGDKHPSVKYKDNNPIFDKDPGTSDGKPYEVRFEEKGGIGNYLNDDEIRTKGRSSDINRLNLHNECFKRLAEQLGKTVDEVKVFKGDSEPVKRLAEKWGCSEKEVWKRCGNPNMIQRVLHECVDKKTVQLVPRLYHDTIPSHYGGVAAYCKDVLEGIKG